MFFIHFKEPLDKKLLLLGFIGFSFIFTPELSLIERLVIRARSRGSLVGSRRFLSAGAEHGSSCGGFIGIFLLSLFVGFFALTRETYVLLDLLESKTSQNRVYFTIFYNACQNFVPDFSRTYCLEDVFGRFIPGLYLTTIKQQKF
jgi:hypothetical protein